MLTLQGSVIHWKTQLIPGRQVLRARPSNIWMLWIWIPGYSSLWLAGLISCWASLGREDILTPLVLWRMVFSYISISWSLRCQSTGSCHCLFSFIFPMSKYVFFLCLIIKWHVEDGNINWTCFSVPWDYRLGSYIILKGTFKAKFKERTYSFFF